MDGRVISSQKYLDYSIVDDKAAQIHGLVTLPVVFAGELDGEKLYILIDGHHTLAAAREIGAEIAFDEISQNKAGWDTRLTLDEQLEAQVLDSDWYYIDNGSLVF